MVPCLCGALSSTPNPLPPAPAALQPCCCLLKGAKVSVAAEILSGLNPMLGHGPESSTARGMSPPVSHCTTCALLPTGFAMRMFQFNDIMGKMPSWPPKLATEAYLTLPKCPHEHTPMSNRAGGHGINAHKQL